MAEQHWIAAAVTTILGGGGLWKWLASRNKAAIASAEERKAAAHERTEQERLDQAQMQQLLDRLSATERRATKLEERIDKQSGKIVALETDKIELHRRISDLEREKRDQALRIEQLEREKAELDQALDLLRGQLEQGDEHIAALTKLVEGLGHQPPPRP